MNKTIKLKTVKTQIFTSGIKKLNDKEYIHMYSQKFLEDKAWDKLSKFIK